MQKDDQYERAMLDPGDVFASPEEVVRHPLMSEGQKAEILRRWLYDASEVAVAEEEGMTGGKPPLVHAIFEALNELGVELDLEHPAPTKQKGI